MNVLAYFDGVAVITVEETLGEGDAVASRPNKSGVRSVAGVGVSGIGELIGEGDIGEEGKDKEWVSEAIRRLTDHSMIWV